jgi:ATP-binding cassette, subfamily B, bacterial
MKDNSERPTTKDLNPLKSALPFLMRYRLRLLFAITVLLIAAIALLAMPVALREVIDNGFSSDRIGSLNKYFLQLLLLAGVFAIFAALRFYTVMWIGERIVADIRRQVYQHVITLSPSFYETTRAGEILTRLTTDTTLVQTVFGAGMSIAVRSVVMLIGAFVMLFITSAKLTILLFLLIPVVVLPVFIYGKRVRKLSRASQDKIADLGGVADETLNNIHIVQAYTLEKLQTNKFSNLVEIAFQTARSRIVMSSILSASMVLIAFSAIVCVLWIGAKEVMNGGMTPGTLGQFLLYATIVAGTTMALGEVWSDVQRAAGAMERLLELLGAKSNIQLPVHPISFSENRGKINLEKISFSYPSRLEQSALVDFSLQVNPGETIALVGPSGAGKSTVFQLLSRFYDPQSGRIILDGVDIRTANLYQLRQRIGIVPQNTVLFADSAMENIRLGKPDATDDEVITAAKIAIADDFICRLPEGYNTFLGEKGVRLSGGQQQRLAIARAILKNPPVLLLDEATSSLDSESEKLVQEALEHLMVDRTTIVIAHRLATVKKVDRIIVMAEGKIVDEGDHNYLIKNDGLYSRLAKLQFGREDTKEIDLLVDSVGAV